jgi:hypothetical protein
MILDKPFVILVQRADAKTASFALWVDNPKVLVHTGAASAPNG